MECRNGARRRRAKNLMSGYSRRLMRDLPLYPATVKAIAIWFYATPS